MNNEKKCAMAWLFAGTAMLIHLTALFLGQYGYFRDELYYLACARHLDIGYVDHPPLSVWILALWKTVFGESLFSIRFLPALFGALTVGCMVRLAKELGGGRYAQILAGVTGIAAPIYLGLFGLYSMNALDLLLWSGAFILFIKALQSAESRYWWLFGLVLGLGSLNKLSMLWLIAGVTAGIILTPARRILKTPPPWRAAGLIFVLFLPFIVWNLTHDFSHLEFMRRAAALKYGSQNPGTFFTGLIMIMNPLALPVWIAGFWLLLSRRDARALGISVSVVLLILIVNLHSKAEYFAGAMTLLLPAGAVWWEARCQPFRRLRWLYVYSVLVSGLLLLPLTKDVLSVRAFTRYQALLGPKAPSTESQVMGVLPQHYADRFGWEEMTGTVADVYRALPDSEKKTCLIYGRNYGEAAAMDFFGRSLHLPPAICQHNSYWYWSQKYLRTGVTLIVIGRPVEELQHYFADVREVARFQTDYVMPYENNLPITVCRKFRGSWPEAWREGRNFI